ncbi:MAG TPA: pyridoxamine 5'-phosphate oxidase family protein [Marmoricola sp.]|jgi:nitroimidazol reductase NimA-like FMN-containing flavoprotein (pyridoxamine 5'-phosphate oxidase superfamily)|nr:pyridoxamine 5'-phosphate oxidase family protein [Marmoricola sp.]
MEEPQELSLAKCRELLSAGVVGRVAFVVDGRPHIVPVNYTVVGESVVVRTTPYSLLGRSGAGTPVAFEVDNLDYSDHKGWSVVAHAVAEHVDDVADLADETAFWDPQPWAGGTRLLYLRLPWTELTGRRLGHGWTRDNEVPVRRQV